MTQQKKYSLAILAAVLAGILGAAYFVRPHTAVAPAPTGTSTSQVPLGNGVSLEVPAGTTVTEIPNTPTSAPKAPDLSHKVAFAPSVTPDVVAALTAQITNLTATLKAAPTQSDAWFRLAIDYKIAGDYKAAEAVWVYLTEVAPQSYVPFADLGDLYQNFLKDYPKAEKNYLAAITRSPGTIDLYRNLYTMYRYQYATTTTKARDIVERGLAANPGNPDLLGLRAELNASN